MGIPSSYKTQDGCHNCVHALVQSDWEEGPSYYCHHDKSDRPTGYGFIYSATAKSIRSTARETKSSRWDTWSDLHEVEPYGICDEHSP